MNRPSAIDRVARQRAARFVCTLAIGVAVGAAQETPSRSAQDALLLKLALDLAAERDPTPISLDADGSARHGAIYDRFTQAHLAARRAFKSGTPVDPEKPPAAMVYSTAIVVAVPIACGNDAILPVDVQIDRDGLIVPKTAPAKGPAAIEAILPGANAPVGAIAVRFQEPSVYPGSNVQITYAGTACPGTSNLKLFAIRMTAARASARPVVELAPGQAAPDGPVTLSLGGVVDPEGRLRYVSTRDPRTPFTAAALGAAAKMRFEPARINLTPVPWTAGVVVTFAVTGADASPDAAGPEMTSADAPGLGPATSQCKASDAATYGVSAFSAIRIGGGPDGAAAREAKYLSALRGPAGQGLRYQSTGSAMVGRAMVDRFDVRYAGLTQPIRLYFDPSREEPLLAPRGFLCAAPLK
jgi:hypothetical protein